MWTDLALRVLCDFEELRQEYPFATLDSLGGSLLGVAHLEVVAVNGHIIRETMGRKDDFLGKYSKLIHIFVPPNYAEAGCSVFGAKWIDLERISPRDWHFLPNEGIEKYLDLGYKLCLGAPQSFGALKNVLLENVRTAEHILVAYENVMRGSSKKPVLFALVHGDAGKQEYCTLRKEGKINLEFKRANSER
ncbi:hypothetical protein IJH89_01140 [Candidatus Saccharibacteria bacterium]|nr:hypothetical protein [Candidatus Saccharibacteria bacterium]